MRAGRALGVVWFVGALVASGAGASAPAATVQEPIAIESQRPAFPLPDIDEAPEAWRDLLENGLLSAPTRSDSSRGPRTPSLASLSSSRWTRQLPALLAERHLEGRPSGGWWIGIGGGPGGGAGLSYAPTPAARLRGEAEVWEGRIPGREHWLLAAQLSASQGTRRPGWRAEAGLHVSREGWDRGAARGLDLPGEMRIAAATGSLARRTRAGHRPLILGVEAQFAEIHTRVCRSGAGAGAPSASQTGRWGLLGIALRTPGTPRDLRRYVGDEDDRVARQVSPLDLDLRAGLGHRHSPEGKADAVGRWSGRMAWTGALSEWWISAGLAGGGEGPRSLLAPVLGLRRYYWERGSCLAFELSPEVQFAEEALAWPERIAGVTLVREAPDSSPWPRAPVVVDPRRPALRAWPNLRGEFFRQGTVGRVHLDLTLARLRDPSDWRLETLAGAATLWRTSSAATRWITRLSLDAERPLAHGLQLGARYRWVRDSRAPDSRRALHFLPAHRIEVQLRGGVGRWRWALHADGRGRAPAALGCEAIESSFTLAARIGCLIGPDCLWLVAQNLLDGAARDEPYERVTRRWVGVQWNHARSESVP